MKTIHEIIDRVDVVIGGVKDVPEARRVLKTFRSALKEQFPATAIICDTRDSVVISMETAYAAERATDWLSHTDGLREKTTAMYNRAQHELYNALKESAKMGTEKMDKGNGFGTTEGDYVYPPYCERSIGDCVSSCTAIKWPGSATPTLKPMSLAEIHASRVIDELWKMYEREPNGSDKFDILRAVTNAVTVLHRVKAE